MKGKQGQERVMELNLNGKLLMEIRRLHAAGTSFGVSKQENVRQVLKELNEDAPSLPKLADIIEGDPGLSIAVIKLANCTLVNGTASKNMTSRQAIIRVGLNGLGVVVKIHQAEMLKRVVSKKCWKDHIEAAMNKALTAGELSYKIAMSLSSKRADAEFALHLAILYSLGVFAKIIAADSMGFLDTREIRDSVLKNSSLAAEAVLITANADYRLIDSIEKIESEQEDNVSILAARAGWGFLCGDMSSVSYKDIKLDSSNFSKGE